MCLIHFNSIIQPFSLALTFWKNGETLKLFSMVFSGTYAPLTSCFPHHIWALVDQICSVLWIRMIRGVIWRNLWNPGSLSEGSFYERKTFCEMHIFLVFFHKMSQCGTFEVTLFSAISGGNDWMNYGSVLRLGHRGSISCLSDPFGIGSPDHRITKKHHEVGRSADAEPRPGEVYFVIFVPWFPKKKLLNFVISLDV